MVPPSDGELTHGRGPHVRRRSPGRVTPPKRRHKPPVVGAAPGVCRDVLVRDDGVGLAAAGSLVWLFGSEGDDDVC